LLAEGDEHLSLAGKTTKNPQQKACSCNLVDESMHDMASLAYLVITKKSAFISPAVVLAILARRRQVTAVGKPRRHEP
jgi:hypothetical protein